MRFNKLITVGAIMGLSMLQPAFSATDVATGAAAGSGGAGAAVDLNFNITIPEFILFQVGTGTQTISFAPSATDVANGTTGTTGTGGDAGAGAVNVRLISNAGTVQIKESNNGTGTGLTNGANNISYAQIKTAETGAGGITPPALSDSGVNASTVTPSSGSVTAKSTVWTYTYDNPALPPAPGTYTGTVTYTAAIP